MSRELSGWPGCGLDASNFHRYWGWIGLWNHYIARKGKAAALDLGQTLGSIRPHYIPRQLLLQASFLGSNFFKVARTALLLAADTVCESARALATASCDSSVHERGSFVPISRDKWARGDLSDLFFIVIRWRMAVLDGVTSFVFRTCEFSFVLLSLACFQQLFCRSSGASVCHGSSPYTKNCFHFVTLSWKECFLVHLGVTWLD